MLCVKPVCQKHQSLTYAASEVTWHREQWFVRVDAALCLIIPVRMGSNWTPTPLSPTNKVKKLKWGQESTGHFQQSHRASCSPLTPVQPADVTQRSDLFRRFLAFWVHSCSAQMCVFQLFGASMLLRSGHTVMMLKLSHHAPCSSAAIPHWLHKEKCHPNNK